MSDTEQLQLRDGEGRQINIKRYRKNDAATKLEAVDWARKKSFYSAAKKFEVDRKRIKEWIQKENELKQQLSNTPKGSKRKCLDGDGRQVNNPELDVELAEWIREKREHKQPVSRRIISNKAGEVFLETDMKVNS
uniref:HTH CENPB-type domain-containing protein n=1 Tax=Ditylenchus dipsaci TaxID=166011 RepID=A0A915DUK7_9BILA